MLRFFFSLGDHGKIYYEKDNVLLNESFPFPSTQSAHPIHFSCQSIFMISGSPLFIPSGDKTILTGLYLGKLK